MAEGTDNICQFNNVGYCKFGTHCQKKQHNIFVSFWMNAEERTVEKDTQKCADITLKGEGADLKRIVLTPIKTKKISKQR